MAELSEGEARALVRAIVELAQMADRALPATAGGLSRRLRDHLGLTDDVVPNSSASFGLIDRANLQIALDRIQDDDAGFETIGLSADIGNYGGVSLSRLVTGDWHGPGEGAREYESVDVGVDETVACLRAGIVLTRSEGEPVAAMVYRREHGAPEVRLDVVATSQEAADRFIRRVRRLIEEHNVLRGKVLTFSFGPYGDFVLSFAPRPTVARQHVILPSGHLEAIEQHAIGISDARDQLLAAGQHLKRGLLLYGPPGTGKTHTVSYLLGRMPGRTTVILSGASVGAVGQAGTLARTFEPATIVIEDVDLIGMDRGLPGGEHNPLLFQLLNEMDGLAGDVDVLFILTTNRADLLEPALAARPGRIDQAIEIPLPDHAGRVALLRLYLPGEVDPAVLDETAERTAGVAAAFIKELARRATLASVRAGSSPSEFLLACVDEMVSHSSPILRASLAAARDDSPDTPSPPFAGPGRAGWSPAPRFG